MTQETTRHVYDEKRKRVAFYKADRRYVFEFMAEEDMKFFANLFNVIHTGQSAMYLASLLQNSQVLSL